MSSEKEKWRKAYRKRPDVKEKERKAFLKRYFKRVYKITLDEYEEMLIRQNGLCAICKTDRSQINHKTKKPENLSVDHCHTTGKVRGLLCTRCNHAIGLFKEDISIIENAIVYLKNNGW